MNNVLCYYLSLSVRQELLERLPRTLGDTFQGLGGWHRNRVRTKTSAPDACFLRRPAPSPASPHVAGLLRVSPRQSVPRCSPKILAEGVIPAEGLKQSSG